MITTDGGGAGGTLLGIKVAEAVETIGKVISRGKPLARQLLLAAGAQEAVLVPGLVTVGHPTSGDGLIIIIRVSYYHTFLRLIHVQSVFFE